jgi:uncharacterized ferritin-like protein (DUF455 family)
MSLSECAKTILLTECPVKKAEQTLVFAQQWQDQKFGVGLESMPPRPGRPAKPILAPPSQMPKRGKAHTKSGKIALLHALAHIELNAIDLAWDLIGRFGYLAEENQPDDSFSLPEDFYQDWICVAADEARHFQLLSSRLGDLGAAYGDLPAHDGLWESAVQTSEDFPARLAIVPMVLEARGLDVTPAMIKNMLSQGDMTTAAILQTIHDEEITHVKAGTTWFGKWCQYHQLDAKEHWQSLVSQYFQGQLKKPFNHDSRQQAGMIRDWYEQLADHLNV